METLVYGGDYTCRVHMQTVTLPHLEGDLSLAQLWQITVALQWGISYGKHHGEVQGCYSHTFSLTSVFSEPLPDAPAVIQSHRCGV